MKPGSTRRILFSLRVSHPFKFAFNNRNGDLRVLRVRIIARCSFVPLEPAIDLIGTPFESSK